MSEGLIVVAAVAQELGDLPGRPVGVGPVRAAIGAARLLAEARPSGVLLIGTAGGYPGGPAIGDVVVARRVGLSTGIAEVDLGYAPLAPAPLETDGPLRDALGLPEVDVLTVEAITTDPHLVAARAAAWTVEHMETYAVAAACAAAEVSFVAVLGISNVVGPDAHAQWLAHRDAAEAGARDAARRLLGSA